MNWKPISTAPKNGEDILICMPGGLSDHYFPVCWASAEELREDIADGLAGDLRDEDAASIELSRGAWQCRWQLDMIVTEQQICACHSTPSWCEIAPPSNSLSFAGA